jgi:hypothetical protein
LIGLWKAKFFWGFYGSYICHEEKHIQNLAIAHAGINH